MSTLTRLCERFQQLSVDNQNKPFSLAEVQKVIHDEIKTLEERKASQPKDTFHFGKYKGKKIEDVAKIDKPYIEWLIRQPWCSNKDELKRFCL